MVGNRIVKGNKRATRFIKRVLFVVIPITNGGSPILRDTSPGSVEIPGFFLFFQRFWAVGIETDIYRLVRLGAVKTPPIRPHQFEVRLSCRNSLPGSRGTQCVKDIERAPRSWGRDIVLAASTSGAAASAEASASGFEVSVESVACVVSATAVPAQLPRPFSLQDLVRWFRWA